MSDWRSQAWYQIHLLGQLLGPDDFEVKRRERMFTAIDGFSHPAHKEAQFHQLEGATRMEVELLRPMLGAEHVRAHVLPPGAVSAAAAASGAGAAAQATGAAGAAAAGQPTGGAASAASAPAAAAAAAAGSLSAGSAAPVAAAADSFELSFDGPAPSGSDPIGAALAHAGRGPVGASVAAAAPAAAPARHDPRPAAPAPTHAEAPEPPRSEFVFTPIKDKRKGRGESPAALYKEAMSSWNDYQVNENKGTADARGKARTAAKSVRDVVLKLGKMSDAEAQLKALLAVVGLSEREVLQGDLERRLR
jgi:hypothetical protein